jgi:hypothetical protein
MILYTKKKKNRDFRETNIAINMWISFLFSGGTCPALHLVATLEERIHSGVFKIKYLNFYGFEP